MTVTIESCVENLRLASESIDNSQPLQVPQGMAPGDMIPQGDIGLLMIEGNLDLRNPVEWKGDGPFQLAPGETKGSRHMIPAEYQEVVSIYRIDDGDPLSDLWLEATDEFDLVHPEHADHLGYPPGCYRVRHQQNAARERVRD